MVRIRLIPFTIFMAALLLCVRVIDITRGTEALAQQTPPPQKTEMAAKPGTTAAGDVAPAKPDDKAKPEAAKDAKSDKEKKDDKAGDGKDDKAKNAAVSDSAGDVVDRRYTPVEVELLQNLVRRREELDRWEKNIEIKEAALDATEKRVDDKILQIESMKKEVASLLAQYNEKEDAKIRSLVKIYESMKPKDAARIFDEVEMPILLLVIDKMSEKKAAPILAEMEPKKAKQITVQLAEQRRVSTSKVNLIAPAGAAPATAPPTP